MNKKRVRLLSLAVLSLVAIVILAGRFPAAQAEDGSPAASVESAWRNAQDAGSYRFISDIDQTLVPRAIPEMIGQQDTALNLALDGAVVMPDQSYVELQLAGANRSESVALLRKGGQSFMLKNGELKPVEDVLNLTSQTNDVLGYLAAAEEVTLVEPPPGHPELLRYSFTISGPRFAEYIREQAETALRAEPGAPVGLSLKPLPALQSLRGTGELWVNQSGLPVRQVLDLEMPEVNEQYGARIQMRVNLFAFGQVDALPRAVQEGNGTWRLEGLLPFTPARDAMGAAGGLASAARVRENQPTEMTTTTQPTWLSRLAGQIPPQIAPSGLTLFILALLASVAIRYYRRHTRLCYILIVVIVVPILLLSTLLRSEHAGHFQERRVQAAEARAAAVPELLEALALETATAEAAPSMVPAAEGSGALQRCGEGEPGADTDGDGLLDTVELCLGTNPDSADSDYDAIFDKEELDGFDLGGKHWDSDPLNADSNRDGVADTAEWAAALAEHGEAVAADLDGDGIPNIWDDDDDGDGVPDGQDLSPFALTGYTAELDLSTTGQVASGGIQTIEVAIQPEELSHLRYSTTALDWPADTLGNVQDLDNSTADLRLTPFLLVTTNVAPDATLAAKYGLRSWVDDQGQTILMAPLQPVEENGAVHAFYAKVAYPAVQTGDIQWQARLVWMVQMQSDSWLRVGEYQTNRMVTETRLLHQYEEPFRVTGLQVIRSEGTQVALFGTPANEDDRYLFQLFVGLGDTFLAHQKLEGQGAGETALDELYARFTAGDTVTHTFGIPAGTVAMAQPQSYANGDEAIAGIGSEILPAFFETYPIYSQRQYLDAEGNAVHSATLLLASEQSHGVYDLRHFSRTDARTADLAQLHVNLASVAVLTTRNVNLRMYEPDLNNEWQIITPARMLELVNARYAGIYGTTLAALYPNLRAQHAQFIVVTGYLWAYAGSLAAVSMDGQLLIPELADEGALALLHIAENALAGNSINYLALATGIAEGLGQSFSWGQGIYETIGLRADWAKLTTAGRFGSSAMAGLGLAAGTASLVMAALNTACKVNPDLQMCQNETAWLIANVAVKELALAVQMVATSIMIVKYALHALEDVSRSGKIAGAIGLAVGIAVTWISFAFTVWLTWGDPIAWRVALGMAIVSTIWMIFLFALNFIPVIGQIIAAVLSFIDALLSLFTGLFAGQDWNFAKIIFNLFYDAKVTSSIKEAAFGQFQGGLADPDQGMIDGNVFRLELPASGVIQKEKGGKDKDLDMSYVEGDLEPQAAVANAFTAQDMSSERDCQIVGDELHCSSTARVGYLLRPTVNGAAGFVARILYQTAWAEYAFYGGVRYKTHATAGMLPEDGGAPITLYLDVLPPTPSALWNWTPLHNYDTDGDGLTVAQEQALGTNWALWDTDGDGLSDFYEWQNAAELGAHPRLRDSDGDGLDDGLELRLGTRINVADSDGDGLSDGAELRHYDPASGEVVGGWQVTLPDAATYWVSSAPLAVDDDGDGLNAYEEKANGLSPHAQNVLVPGLSLSAGPVIDIPDARQGLYWLPGTVVSFTIDLANVAYAPVTTTLSLTLPAWLDTISGGVLQGDRTIAPVQTGNVLTWDFTGAHALQLYEIVSTTVTARVNPETTSAHDEIALDLTYGDVQMHKPVQATVDGDNPDVAIVAPTDGAYLRGTSYVVGGAATDVTTWITEASLSIVPQGNGTSFQTLAGSKSPWAYTWNLPATDGIYTLHAQAKDAMGHASTTDAVSVTVDNTPPVVTLSSEMAGSTVHLSGTATDNLAGVEWVQLAIDNQPWRSVPLNGTAWSYDWTVGEGAQGDHEVAVRAIDRSGNESTMASDTITVDSVPPSSAVNRGADLEAPPAVAANSTFTLTGVADEGGHLPLPAVPADLRTGMDVFDDSTLWLGLSSIHDNDGGVLATWIGDFNADRLADLAVGLPGRSGDAGQVVVLYGRGGGWPAAPDLEMLAGSRTRFRGAAGARLGSYLASAGDANGDAYADLLIGERASGRAFLVFGNPGPLGAVTLEAGQAGYRSLLQAPANIGGLAAAGDVDGDGLGDLLIQAGGTAYLLLGRSSPWPETVDVATDAVAAFSSATGALGVGDVDNDQRAEWVTMMANQIALYGWNASAGHAEAVTTVSTADATPRVVALGDVDGDGKADWLYSNGTSRVLAYGSGGTHTFSGYGGVFAAPGDVDGDGRPDILLATAAGAAALIRQQTGESPEVFATIAGVGGAANAPYAAGADLNSDGSAELLLIPSQAAAEARGFDAPDFSSGFVSPQELPLGVSSTVAEESTTELTAAAAWPLSEYTMSLALIDVELQSAGADTRYVDDDAVSGTCEGNSPCFTTIQAAVNASDGGGDTIVVYPGVYDSFQVPAGSNYDYLNVQGVSADAVFVEGGTGDAIHIGADGVCLSNLTVRNATRGVVLDSGAGEVPVGSGSETAVDQLLVHSVDNAIAMSQSAALTLSDSTLVGNGTHPILSVDTTLNSAVHTWHADRTLAQSPGTNAGLASTGGTLYAVQGGTNATVYTATPGADGALGQWSSAFNLAHALPAENGKSLLAAGGNYLYQMHPHMAKPDFGASNGEIRAVAIAPNGDVYVGGHFTTIGGISALNVARWDGSAWHPLGTNLSNGLTHTDGSGTVYAITILSSTDVYFGGKFNRGYAGSESTINNVARWDGTSWHPLGGVANNGTDGPVYALEHSDDGYVFVGGSFSTCLSEASGSTPVYVTAKNFAMWKGRWQNAIANGVDGPIRTLDWSGGVLEGRSSEFPENGEAGKLYAGGDFVRVDNEYLQANVDDNFPVIANHVAYWHVEAWNYSSPHRSAWVALGSGISNPVVDLTLDQTTETDRLYAAADASTYDPLHYWDGGSWGTLGPSRSNGYSAVALDTVGNVYAAALSGGQYEIYIGAAGSTNPMNLMGTETTKVWDLVPDGAGQVLAARGAQATLTGAIRHWAMASLYRRDLSGTTWEWFPYPPTFDQTALPRAVVADDAGNLYASSGTGSLYRFNAASTSWEARASLALTNLVWADSHLYALAYNSGTGQWSLYRYDTTGWTQLGSTPLPTGAATADSRSWAGDGVDSIYVLQASGMYRYRISDNAWDSLPQPSIAFTVAKQPGLVRAADYLYLYASPGTGVTTNVFRYGAVGAPDLRLTVERTALVMPDSASSFSWINLSSRAGTYRLLIDVDNTNAWVGPSSASWSPALATGATTLTAAQADFMAPEDGLYRLGPDSQLTAGYHHYKAVAHVYPSQAACTGCTDGSLTWGDTAFAIMREAVESGAARVLVHPGRYPQTFYLVSGVEVVGSGAETTIIEPPAATGGTLVTAEGAAGASLARVTLAGTAGWQGFLAEGGATGLTLSRCIIRDLDTGVRLREGSEVEVVNNTIVRNADGLVAEGATPVNVRNTIFAYHSGAGLQHGATTTSRTVTYNDFWANGADMNPAGDLSLGTLFVDPRFRSLAANDFRLAAGSPLIDKGEPGDPTVPGGGERVDIGYAEYNTAGFYVSKEYSETGVNDGLTWGVDAFDQIQPALEAAAASLYGLQGALPEGGYSVGVDEGTYTETLTVPSHVRLVGSGADVTTIDANNAGSAVTFDGVIDSELTGFTVRNASSSGAGVELKNSASSITIARNVIRASAGHGVSLAGSSSAELLFNTIVNNGGAGVYATGAGTWADAGNNILDGNTTGLQAASGGLIRNDYNLLHNTTNVSGVTAGANTVTADSAFAVARYYVPAASSAAIDAAEPWAEVPVAGGLRADLGYKELIASPLTLVFGPEVDSTVTGNSGVARVEVGVILVTDATQPVTSTLPASTDWQTLTPAQTGQPFYYWSQSVSQATPGLYRVYSRATDAAGNVEGETLDWYEGAFVVDNTAPTITWGSTLPTTTDAAALLAKADAVGTVSTGSGTRDDVAQFYFAVDAQGSRTVYPAESGQAWIPLAATGSYTITAIAVDEAGNQVQQSATVGVSASSHVATVVEPAANSSVNNTNLTLRGYVRFTGTGAGAVTVGVTGGTTSTATLEQPGATFSAWSAEITLPAGDGAKMVTVTPSLDGATGTATTLTLTLDTTGPVLDVTSPAAGTTVSETVAFAGAASDTGSGLARVEVSMDGGYTWRQAALTSGAWSLDWEMAHYQDHVSYPAQVRAVDSAGNVTLVERTATVDSVPPTVLVVTFDQPEGQHLEAGSSLQIGWNVPVDAGGAVQVLLAVDQTATTEQPGIEVPGTSYTDNLNAIGDWYLHLMARDAAGNETLSHYGPWHVRDLTNTTFSNRRHSIILDGFLDVEHDEWLATDLLGVDARSGNPQALYASWDGQDVYLGWSGAWWTLDGTLWAYLDVTAGGTATAVDGSPLPPALIADRAVEISGPGTGTLWSWNGSAWVEGSLDFANGPNGDTEARIAYTAAGDHTLGLLAFALPVEAEVVQDNAPVVMSLAEPLALAQNETLLPDEHSATPWAMFPTTNGLAGDATQTFVWSEISSVTEVNAGQPTARTAFMEVTSPQAAGTASCPQSDIVYDILLENPETGDFSGLTLTLAASSGLSYQSVTGATLTSGAAGDASWTLSVPTLAAGTSTHVAVTASTATDLSALTMVTSTITLSAGATSLTAESNPVATAVHHVDGLAPVVNIDTLGGAAIAAGEHTFTGTAGDGDGSGLARVEVSGDGGATWQSAGGTLAWSAALSTSGTTFTLQARAVDVCGYTSAVASQTFSVDSTPPTVSWTAPAVVTTSPSRVTGSTADPAPVGSLVQRVEVQVDSASSAWLLALGPFTPQDATQPWIWSWPTPQEDGISHTLRVRATDAVGNQTVTPWQETLVDTVAPQITVTEQLTRTALTSGPAAQPILAGTVGDGSGVQTVRVLVYDTLGNAATADATLTGGSWAYIPDLSEWGIGNYALRVQAVDVHGNVRTQGPYHLAVEDAPVEGLAATNDGPRMIGELVTFTATISAGTSVTYTWAFGDGATAPGQVATHAYTASGAYTATVTASNGVSAMEATTAVTVLALSLEAGDDQTADEGANVTVNATFTDGRESVTHTATIDWGDGTTPDSGMVDEEALTISGSHAYADNGAYTVTVTVGDGQGHTAADSLEVTVSNVAPTATLTNDGPQGEAVAVTVAFTDVHDAGTADTFTYSFDWHSDGTFEVVDQSAGSAQHTWLDNGAYTVAGRVQDDDGGYTDYTTQVTVTNVAPAVMAEPVSQTVAYSEALAEITFRATDVPADTMTAVLSWSSDGTTFPTDLSAAGLVLGDGVCTEDAAARTCIWTVTGTVHLAVGSHTVRLAVTDKDGGVTNKDVTLVVEPEEAEVTFDTKNPVAVQVAAAGDASGPFTLAVCVHEADTASPGDIRLATVSMSLVPVGPGGAVAGVAGTPTTSEGQLCVTFSFNAVPVNTYVVDVSVGGNYAGHNEDVLVVYDPSLGFTTGGGWFYWPETANPETGYPGDKTNFGFTMKYNKKGQNVQGSLLLIRHLEDGTIYRVKSNALYGLALGEDPSVPMGWASFSGKSTYQEPGWVEPIGNYEFTVYVEDRNEPGSGVDRLWIEVSGGLALPRNAIDNARNIEGGNLVVPHKAR